MFALQGMQIAAEEETECAEAPGAASEGRAAAGDEPSEAPPREGFADRAVVRGLEGPQPAGTRGEDGLVAPARAGEEDGGARETPVAPMHRVSVLGIAEQLEAPATGAGVRADSLAEGLEEGSRRRAEVEADVAEATRLLEWLEVSHPAWLRAGGQPSRIADAATRRDLLVERFAKRGRSYCQQGRCAVVAYERFIAKHAHLVVGGAPYPPTTELVAWFLLWNLDLTRAKKRRAGKPFKGTSGKQRKKALGYAAALFSAPFDADLLGAEEVVMASKRPPDAEEAGVAEAHVGVFVQCWMEAVAAGAFPDGAVPTEVERDYAAGFAACGITSLRTEEMLRSQVKGISEEAGGEALVLHCAGGKTSSKADMRPFDAALPLGVTGFLGGPTGAALLAFAKRHLALPFVFRRITRHASGPRWYASVEAARPDDVSHMFYHILARCGLEETVARSFNTRPYGFRHLLPDITRRAGWRLEDRMELGRWSVEVLKAIVMAAAAEHGTRQTRGKVAGAGLAAACANLYSRGKAAFGREIELRRAACAVVRDHIGDRVWTGVVPVQREAPSFDFLFPGSQAEELASDSEESGEE
jgi:hypothetical protein